MAQIHFITLFQKQSHPGLNFEGLKALASIITSVACPALRATCPLIVSKGGAETNADAFIVMLPTPVKC